MTHVDEDFELIRQIVADGGRNTPRGILTAAGTIDWSTRDG